MPDHGLAERLLSAYQDAEPWKVEHDARMECFQIEDAITAGNALFALVSEYDFQWHERVMSGVWPYSEASERPPEALYRLWLGAAERVLERAETRTREGHAIKGLEEYRDNVREARGVLTPDDDFFTSEELADLRDAAIEDHRAGLTEPMDGDGCWD